MQYNLVKVLLPASSLNVIEPVMSEMSVCKIVPGSFNRIKFRVEDTS